MTHSESASLVAAVDDGNFADRVLGSDVPVLVDFTATWCGPCKLLAPILERFAAERGAALKVVKIDMDDAPATCAKYGVRAAPTMMFFRGGERRAMHVGLVSREKLAALVSSWEA